MILEEELLRKSYGQRIFPSRCFKMNMQARNRVVMVKGEEREVQ